MQRVPETIGVVHIDDLEDWSLRAAQALQEICDEVQAASGNPDGTDLCPDIRELLEEHSRIVRGESLT